VAADRLAETAEWRNARVIKCNPDAPQRPVRLRALREGKVVFNYMLGVPKFRQ
jgi:5-formyltetrahydrofolate cyclo-ligase